MKTATSNRARKDGVSSSCIDRRAKKRRVPLGQISYRHAVSDDYPTLAWMHSEIHAVHSRNAPEIFKEPSLEAFGPDAIEDYLNNMNGFIFVAVSGKRVIGYISGRVVFKDENTRKRHRKMIYLDAIFIEKLYRGSINAIGIELVDLSKNYARKKRVKIIAFDVWAFNRVAMNFCEQLRFPVKNVVMYDFL